jgi:serine/threonine protein kinase
MSLIIGDLLHLNKNTVKIEECIKDEESIKYYLVKDTENKTFMLKAFSNTSETETYKNEVQGFKAIGLHGKILQVYDNVQETEYSYILFEYPSRFTLESVIQSQSPNDSQIITIVRDVLLALFHIHSRKYIHSRISIQNIYVSVEFRFKLGGFYSVCHESCAKTKDLKIPLEFKPPELIENNDEVLVNGGVDIWQLGCLIYRLLYSQDAFAGASIDYQLRGKYAKSDVQVADCWKLILSRVLDPNPATRASIQEIITLIHESYMPKMIFPESVEYLKPNSMLKRSSSSWVKAITSENETIPDPVYTTKLIGKAWNKPFKIPKFFQSLSQRPFTKALVCLKCLIIIFKYITLGPKSSFETEMGGPAYMEELDTYWMFSTKPKKEKFHTDDLIETIRACTKAIKNKFRVHFTTKVYGNWSDLTIADHQGIANVIEYWGNSIQATKALMLNPEVLLNIKSYFSGLFMHEQQKIMMELIEVLGNYPELDTQRFHECQNETIKLIQSYKSIFPNNFIIKIFLNQPDAIKPSSNNSNKASPKSNSKGSTQKKLKNEPETKIKDELSRKGSIKFEESSWSIKMNELELKQSIGVGGSCTVYKGNYRHTPVAIKVLKNNSQNSLKEFEREVETMVKLRHPNLVLFMGACMEKELCIVTEFCFGDTLFHFLHEKRQVLMSYKQQLKVSIDIAKGMAFLHSSNIIHRDLKSLNLLLTEPVNSPNDRIDIKITDFGISRTVSNDISNDVMTGQMGTCHWMAPEVLANHPYGLPADVYSYAIVLWEVFAREIPYKSVNPAMIPYQVLHQDLRPTIAKVTSEPIKTLIVKCWDKDQSIRPTFSEVLEYLEKLVV